MRKLLNRASVTLVRMTNAEFLKLSHKASKNVPNDTDIDISWIDKLIAFKNNSAGGLATLKTKCLNIITNINDVLDDS